MHAGTKNMYLSILYYKGDRSKFLKFKIFRPTKTVFILVKSADPDEMEQFVCQNTLLPVFPLEIVNGK